jgi:NodT family efflux transporter outer membrane factor (OMF) lipoprotein
VKARHFLVLGAILLTGCTPVGPDYHLPEQALFNAPAAQGTFVSRQTATNTGPSDSQWWQLYNDSRLTDFVQEAFVANTDLRIAVANLEHSQALFALAQTGRQINGVANFDTSYVQQSAEANLSHIKPPQHQIANTGISLNYDLDLFGGIRRGIEAAAADNEAAMAAHDLVRINVAADTTRAFADICNAGNELKSALRTLDVQKKALTLTRTLFRNGRAASFDIDRQQGLYDELEARIPALQARQLNAAYRLTTLIGQPPERYDRKLLKCTSPLKLISPIPTGDGAALLRRRPDVKQAERHLAASTARIGVATAELYPDIKLTASVGTQGAITDLFSPLTNRFGVGPTINWNVNTNVARARIDAAQAQARADLATFDRTILIALRETETALTNYAYDLDRLQHLKKARDRALVVSNDSRKLWQGGNIDALAALDAERSLATAEQAYAAAETSLNTDQIALFLALGGGWQSITPPPERTSQANSADEPARHGT